MVRHFVVSCGLLDSQHSRLRRTGMFVWPIGTDAPVHHFPWATIALIVAKSLVFLGAACGWIPVEPLVLAYGDGLHPLQWLTSLFIHNGLLHLAGNLFFLWGFGLIVEGKLGWQRFLAVYLGLGVVESALEQISLHHLHGSSMGASAAIAGLMAMAVVWAPRNEIIFGYGIMFSTLTRVGTFELTIVTFSSLWAALEMLCMWWLDIRVSAAALHLLGGLLGWGMAVALLKQGHVDCEGWDFLSLYWKRPEFAAAARGSDPWGSLGYGQINPAGAARRGRRRSRGSDANLCAATNRSMAKEPQWDRFLPAKWSRRHRKRVTPDAVGAEASRRKRIEGRVQQLLSEGKPGAAVREWRQFQHFLPDAQLPQDVLRRLFEGLLAGGMWQDAVPLMEEYIARFEDDAALIRMLAASVLLHRLGRPKAALRMLQALNYESLPSSFQRQYEHLAAAARALIDSGVIELSSPPSPAASS